MSALIPSHPPTDYPRLFRSERTRLLALLSTVSAADWGRPTPCPGWDVRGLVTHLVGDDLSLISWQRDGFRGTIPPEGLDEGGFVEWIDELQVEWVHAARRFSPRLALQLLEWGVDTIADTFDRQDPSARTAHVSWASDAPVPVWLDQARELSEYWIHRQQLLEALGRPVELDEALAGPVLDALKWAVPFRLGRSGSSPGDGVSVAIAGPFERTWRLAVVGDLWTFADEPVAVAATQLTMTVDQAWRLLTNNYRPAEHGEISASGDPRLFDTVLATRSIIGTPKTR